MANIRPRKNKDNKITSYQIRVFKGRDTNGKQLKPYILNWKPDSKWSDGKIQKELQKAAFDFERQCNVGEIADKKQSFAEYADYVITLKENVEKKKHRTIKRYKELLERIKPAIGHIKIQDLKPQHLNKLYEQLRQPGMNLKTGGFLSDKTIREYHSLIHVILEKASEEMLVLYNAASKATKPKYKRKESNFIEIENIQKALDFAQYEPLKWRVALNLLVFTGGRRGEVAGITVNKINFDENTIDISQALLYSSDIGIYLDDTKNESSNRLLKLPEEVMVLVKQLIEETEKKAVELGDKWTSYPFQLHDKLIKHSFLLTQENGKPMHPDSITDYCENFRIKYNNMIRSKEENKNLSEGELEKLFMPKINPHAFRHSQASILINSGADVAMVSKQLGHASPTVTQNIYTHAFRKANEHVSNLMANAILKK